MKVTQKHRSNTNHQAKGMWIDASNVQILEYTLGQMEEMRRQEINWTRKHYGPRGQRAVREARELKQLVDLMKAAKYREVGLLFQWKSGLLVSSIPGVLNPVAYGFRTYPVSHPTVWKSLQDDGKVPQDITYDLVPRGRVTFNQATGTFTFMGDRCIVKNKDLVRAVINKLNLPPGTEVVVDDQYLCPKCLKSKSSGGPNYEFDGEWDY
jgi:hypothetical protein